jgi:Tfp pilus assembly protein PilN
MLVLDLNLASRPFRNNTLHWTLFGVGVVAVVAFTAWNVAGAIRSAGHLEALREEREQAAERLGELQRREQEAWRRIEAQDLTRLDAEASLANEVLSRKGLSWTGLFNRLEEVVPYEVRMVSVRPDFRADGRRPEATGRGAATSFQVSVEGLARSLEPFLEFERALMADPHFGRVEPERLSTTTGRELQFSLSFLYDPEGRQTPAEGPAPLVPFERPDDEEELDTGGADRPRPAPVPPPAPPVRLGGRQP